MTDPAVDDNALSLSFAPDGQAPAQDAVTWRDLRLRDFRPRARLVGRHTRIDRAAVPVVDAHNHLGRWLCDGQAWMVPDVDALLRTMDDCGVERIVNLDGRWGQELDDNLARYDRAHPGRFSTYCHLDWGALRTGADGDDLAAQLDVAADQGARGVKIWKDLGLSVRDAAGDLVMPDDVRVVTAARRAGALGLPVLIHTADPVAFFDPLDEHNERIEELAANPQWWFGDRETFPTFARLLSALEGLVSAAPETTFIGAHVGGHAENLDAVAAMLTRCPNFHIDVSGRMGELGRQPRAFTRLVAAHPDRVVFGSDAFPVCAEDLRRWYRFLETDDEHWPYDGDPGDVPGQGRWAVSAAALPPHLLSAVYRDNAVRLGL